MRTNNTVRVRPSASDPDAHATHFYREPHSAIWPRMQPLRHSTRRVRRPPVCVMLSVFRRGGAKRRHHHAETVQKLSGEQTAAAGMGERGSASDGGNSCKVILLPVSAIGRRGSWFTGAPAGSASVGPDARARTNGQWAGGGPYRGNGR